MQAHRLLIGMCVLALALHAGAQTNAAENQCGALANNYGPYDYRTERGQRLATVERTYFLPQVEAGIRGATSPAPGVDIDYTLRAFPNHHRALLAMVKLAEKQHTAQPTGSRYTIDCWFDRALRFQPDDTTVRMLFASHLHKTQRTPEALAHLEKAVEQAQDNPFTHYNIGLVYADLKVYDKALTQAHRALELGFARSDLQEILQKAGQWKEPSATAAPAAPASAAQ